MNANKFPWAHAEVLRWQDGLHYVTPSQQPARLEFPAELEDLFWRRRSYLFDPPWLPKLKVSFLRLCQAFHVFVFRVSQFVDPLVDAKVASYSALAASGAKLVQQDSGLVTTLQTEQRQTQASKDDVKDSNSKVQVQTPVSQPAATNSNASDRVCVAIGVDVVKGRMMMVQRSAVNSLTMAFTANDIRGDDIAVCGTRDCLLGLLLTDPSCFLLVRHVSQGKCDASQSSPITWWPCEGATEPTCSITGWRTLCAT